MKATGQYFPVVLFIMLCKMVLTFGSLSVTIQMKATEQYFTAQVLFIMLYKVVLTFKSLSVTIQMKAIMIKICFWFMVML